MSNWYVKIFEDINRNSKMASNFNLFKFQFIDIQMSWAFNKT